MADQADVFIGYSRKNSQFVDRLVADLQDHQITVWLDRITIDPGDRIRQRIERAIENCTYFCFVITKASMQSYYASQVELEAAITHMIETRKSSFILPILREKPNRPLPLFIRDLHRIDLSTSMKYRKNLKQLIKKIKLEDEHFTGVRLYKGVDTSFEGTMVGVGPIQRIASSGPSFRVHFDDGKISAMDWFENGERHAAKSVLYDRQGRVAEIVLFGDREVIDTWKYIYDSKTGRRIEKHVVYPGRRPSEIHKYDDNGRKISERHLDQKGQLDQTKPVALKQWVFNEAGNVVTEVWRNSQNKVVKRIKNRMLDAPKH